MVLGVVLVVFGFLLNLVFFWVVYLCCSGAKKCLLNVNSTDRVKDK